MGIRTKNCKGMYLVGCSRCDVDRMLSSLCPWLVEGRNWHHDDPKYQRPPDNWQDVLDWGVYVSPSKGIPKPST